MNKTMRQAAFSNEATYLLFIQIRPSTTNKGSCGSLHQWKVCAVTASRGHLSLLCYRFYVACPSLCVMCVPDCSLCLCCPSPSSFRFPTPRTVTLGEAGTTPSTLCPVTCERTGPNHGRLRHDSADKKATPTGSAFRTTPRHHLCTLANPLPFSLFSSSAYCLRTTKCLYHVVLTARSTSNVCWNAAYAGCKRLRAVFTELDLSRWWCCFFVVQQDTCMCVSRQLLEFCITALETCVAAAVRPT